MQDTLRCPGCHAELTLTASDAASAQCPRCRSVVDLVRPAGTTALTADAPLPTVRLRSAKPDLDDDLPVDLRTLVRPDPLTGQWKAVLAAVALTSSVLSFGVQGYFSYERAEIVRTHARHHVVLVEPMPLQASPPFARLAMLVHEAVYWPAVACFLFWIYQASRNLKLLRAAGMSHTPGTAVVLFFVPFVNMYRPYFIMQEIWRGSDPRAAANSLAWLDARPGEAIRCWWFFFLAANLLAVIARQFAQSASLRMQGTAAWMYCVSHLCMFVAGVLLVRIIIAVTMRQRERYERLYAEA